MRHPKDISRRQFLTRAGGTALAMPSLAAILAACNKPGEELPPGTGGTSPVVGLENIPIATLEAPVTLPFNDDPISADTPHESGPLILYNWKDYIYKKEVAAFSEEFGVDVEITTFNNMEEGIQKIAAGGVEADVFVPTPGYLRRLVSESLVQPLQHDLIPNMEANVWPSYSVPGPYYDLEWRYTVPYTIYTWGVAYRRDLVPDEDAAAQGWDALWNNEYAGKISLYDSYGDTIAVAIMRNGSLDVNTGDAALIEAAKESILQTINENEARLTINGVYAKIPAGEFTVAEAWSGDIVGAQWYLPKGTGTDVLGYWRPPTGQTMIGNDLLAIPSVAKNPRLAHEFINFFLDEKHGYSNFVNWNGYQPPFTTIEPDRLIDDGVVPENLDQAVVTEAMFKEDLTPYELPPDVDDMWLQAWTEITAGRDIASLTEEPDASRRRRRRRRDVDANRSSGVWYPRWYWPSFVAPASLWLIVLFVLPFYVVFAVAFGTVDEVFRLPVPYYAPWWWSFSTFNDTLSQFYAGEAIYQEPLIRTFAYVVAASAICLVLGYAVAYYTARYATKYKGLVLILLVSPLWISYLMRIYAWQSLLDTEGPVNWLLGPFGFGDTNWLEGKSITVILGLVYGYIPFMILPLYAFLDRIEGSLLEAGRDLGASGRETFWRVTLPLSRPAILTGMVIVSLPMFGDYYTNDLLGSTKTVMFGNLISRQKEQQGGATRSASLVLMLSVMMFIPMLYYLRETKKQAELT